MLIFRPRRYELRQLLLYINEVIGKTRDKNFKVSNLRWDFTMRARLSVASSFPSVFKYPVAHWEKVERVCQTIRLT